MATGLTVGGDVEQALGRVGVPSYVLDTTGVVRGSILQATDATAAMVSTAGTRVAVEISSVPLMNGERVVGVFGLFEELPDHPPAAPHPHLTPRQVEVLRLLEQGRSTKQIAAQLHLSTETVRNHIRRLFRALGVHSRLEAVAAARAASPH
jgi:DNA-binding NarL/FixJ family response regulator